jgi:hypothetical protein
MDDADGGTDSDAEDDTLNFSGFAAVDAGRTERRRGETFTTTAPRAQIALERASVAMHFAWKLPTLDASPPIASVTSAVGGRPLEPPHVQPLGGVKLHALRFQQSPLQVGRLR